MSRLWIVAASIATHALVIGLLSTTTPPRVAAVAAPSIQLVEPPPIEVVMLDPETPIPPSPDLNPSPNATSSSGASATASMASTIHRGTELSPSRDRTPTTTTTPSTTAPPGKSMLHMRYGPEYVSSIQSMLDRAVDMPPGTPPAQIAPSGLLHDDGGGTKRGDEGEFHAKVDRDGSVAFDDGANVRLGGRRGPPVNPDGPGATVLSFDMTDALMRRHGIDPYASAKLKFLDRTRAERVEIGLAYRKDQLAHTAPIMSANIARAFAISHGPAAQRRALFELWDDCAETGTDELVEAGRVGRALVIGAIRTHFPAGSADAYTADEIALLAHRQTSKATFVPYE